MTWFGIVVVVYWILNIAGNFYIMGEGGTEVTPAGAFVSTIIQSLLLLGVFLVGTGVM